MEVFVEVCFYFSQVSNEAGLLGWHAKEFCFHLVCSWGLWVYFKQKDPQDSERGSDRKQGEDGELLPFYPQ